MSSSSTSVTNDGEQLVTPQETAAYITAQQRICRNKMLQRFFLICIPFPVVYILRMARLLSPVGGLISFLLLSILGKLLFSSAMISCCMSLMNRLNHTSSLVARSAETRRTFLRYMVSC